MVLGMILVWSAVVFGVVSLVRGNAGRRPGIPRGVYGLKKSTGADRGRRRGVCDGNS
jgi:hypothetical protein